MNKTADMKSVCLLGAHFSIANGLHNALYEANALGCNTLQIFTKNASTWKERTIFQKDIDAFKLAKKETGIKTIASHASYLINPATDDKKKRHLSLNALAQELVRSSILGIYFVVLHPGSHMGKGEKEGISRIADGINKIFDKVPDINTRLLFETTAGQGSSLGHRFEQLASIMDLIDNKDGIGVCLDTCHIFAAGYDIRTKTSFKKTLAVFDSIIGINNLYLFHFNDSKKRLGSRVDRHEHIGEGLIGIKAFELFMKDSRFCKIPKIIETPKKKGKEDDSDKKNLNRLWSTLNC